MGIQPDVVLAACPVCGDPTVKLDHVQKCVDELKQRLADAERFGHEAIRTAIPFQQDPEKQAFGKHALICGGPECPVGSHANEAFGADALKPPDNVGEAQKR